MSAENQKTILLVEDEAITAMAEKMTLEKFGYKIITANNGEEAVATVKKTPGIDLILIDINLGTGIDGTEAAVIILQQRDLPVVFLSSHTEPEVVAKTEKISSYGYVVKDSSGTVLDASIKMAFKLFEAKTKEQEKESRMAAALEVLHENEERMRVIVEGSPHLFFYIQDAEANNTYVSPTVEYITGHKTDIWLKRKDWFITDAAMNQIAKDMTHAHLRGEFTEEPVLLEVRHAGGHPILLEAYEYPITNNGRVVGLQGVAHDITRRKLIESQREAALAGLRESEERYRTLIENASDLVYRTDKAGHFTFINRAALTTTGYEERELIGKFYPTLIRPDMRNRVVKIFLHQIRKGTHNTYSEFPILTKDGREIWLGQNIQMVVQNGQVTGFQAVSRDITERKQAEASLKQALNWQQTIFEGSRDAIFISDQDSRFVAVNNAACDLTGYSREQLLKMRIPDIHDLPDLDAYKMYHQRIFGGEETLSEAKILRSDSAKIDTEFNNRCVSIAGKLYMHTTARDISERKRAEAAFQREKAYLEQFIESAPEAIVLAENNGQILRVNSEFEKMFGYSAKEAIGRLIDDLVVPPKYRLEATDVTQTVAQGEKFSLETVRWRKDGALLHVSLVGSPILIGGEQVAAYGIYRDISDRKQAEAEIVRQLAEKEILLKEVHHRIKNNIASIGGLLSLHVQSATNPEAIAVLQEAIGRVNSMRILYDKLLLSEGYKDVSVKNYVESLVDSVISLFPDMAKIALDKQINDFHLDSKQLFPLGIIINELLTNIMKYAFVNRDAGLVKISLTNVDNRVTLTIQDNGIGLPAGFDINEPEGFGLKLVKMLSQQLGGSFSIKKHAGTRCKIEFNI